MADGWIKVVATVGGLGMGVVLSVLAGTPAALPAASLDWELLLHVERAVADGLAAKDLDTRLRTLEGGVGPHGRRR